MLAAALGLAAPLQAAPVSFDRVRPLLEIAYPLTGAKALELPRGKPVLVSFFASWCPPCKEEFANLNEVWRRIADGDAAIVGVNLFEAWAGGEDPARMRRFLAQTQPQFPLVRGNEMIRRNFDDLKRIPSMMVFDGEGREVWRFVHADDGIKANPSVAEIVSALELAGVRF